MRHRHVIYAGQATNGTCWIHGIPSNHSDVHLPEVEKLEYCNKDSLSKRLGSYGPEAEEIEKLTGRDLTHWKN